MEGRIYYTALGSLANIKSLQDSVIGSPGTYILLIKVDQNLGLEIGKLGYTTFRTGYYCYVGSALGGLRQRLVRHLSTDKKLHWHIDYLLRRVRIHAIFWCYTPTHIECRISQKLNSLRVEPIKRFGASDCRCSSHLYYLPTLRTLKKAAFVAIRQAFDIYT